ncbi:MAG: DUF3667 domain-containing protein [Oceanicaulis sp.]
MSGIDEAAQTSAEHAAAAAAAAGGGPARARPSRPAELAPDTPEGVCANCQTGLRGPVCHVCGQVADEYHRPMGGLLGEIVEGFTALDGRVARTIPNLLLRPGRITRAYLKGARARFMPPFRLYIIASLIFFLLIPAIDNAIGDAELASFGEGLRSGAMEDELEAAVAAGELTEEEAEAARRALEQIWLGPREAEEPAAADPAAAAEGEASQATAPDTTVTIPPPIQIGVGGENSATPDAIRRYFAPEDFGEPAPDTIFPLPVRRHLGERFAEAQTDPVGWLNRAAQWAPRIMFVMVPVYALLLSLVYVWRRRFFFYDHLIVSLHLHSALFLVLSLALMLGGMVGAGWAWLAVIVYSNVYLYRLHRVVYGRGRFSSVVRTIVLDLLYLVVLMLGFFAVLLLGALV